ncbi:MAG: Crp/Fnr family transcriptional regulator [Chitinophagaceae bacterium]
MIITQVVDIRYYYEQLLAYLQRYAPITKDDLKLLTPFLEVRNFERRTVILEEGEVDYYLNIVMRGIVRKNVKVDRGDMTLQLATEGHFIHSEVSFHHRIASEMSIETVEPSTLVSIHYNNLQIALNEIPWLEKMARRIVIDMYLKKDLRTKMHLTKKTRERFVDYVNSHPQLLQRVPQKILASYLNIKPETFSRLKHLLKKN